MKPLLALLALGVGASPASAQAAGDRLGSVIRQAIADQGEIVTAADHRTIAAKCGLAPGAAASRNVSFTGGALHCPDGRLVQDGETHALADRIAARAGATVNAAMQQPQVAAAIAAVADEASLRALRELRRDRR